jgi:hypothetical protein
MGKVFTENGVMIDLDELRKVVAECDVFAIGFRLFPQRLMVDTRTSDEVGPMAELVEPVNTVEERFFWLGKRRPSFGVPERFTFFVWPHSLALLVECGVADNIRQRLVASERPEMAEAADRALEELERLERDAVREAIVGKNHHTLWQRD